MSFSRILSDKIIFFLVLLVYTVIIFGQDAGGLLRLNLDKSDVKIIIDGKFYDTGISANEDIIIELTAGEHTIRLTKEGFVDEVRKVSIESDEVTKLTITFKTASEVLLKKEETGTQLQGFGKLTIISKPPGATILIDGRPFEKARTPDTFDKMPAGSVKVGADRNGIKEERFVKIEKNKTTKVVFDLRPKYGNLTVFSEPKGAKVYLNGGFLDTTPITESRPVGRYSLRITASDWLEEKSDITIQHNKNTVVNALLRKPFPEQADFGEIDIGRPKKPRLLLSEDSLKPEYYFVRRQPKWLKWALVGSALSVPVGSYLISTTPRDSEGERLGINATIGALTIIAGSGSFLYLVPNLWTGNRKESFRVPIEENVECNKPKRQEIRRANAEIDGYNAETERLLAEEQQKRQKLIDDQIDEIKRFNSNRGLRVEVKSKK